MNQRAEAVGVGLGLLGDLLDGQRVDTDGPGAGGVGHQMAAHAVGELGRIVGEQLSQISDAGEDPAVGQRAVRLDGLVVSPGRTVLDPVGLSML